MSEATGYKVLSAFFMSVTAICLPAFMYFLVIKGNTTEDYYWFAILNMSVFIKLMLGMRLYERHKRERRLPASGHRLINYGLFRFH